MRKTFGLLPATPCVLPFSQFRNVLVVSRYHKNEHAVRIPLQRRKLIQISFRLVSGQAPLRGNFEFQHNSYGSVRLIDR